MLALASLSPNSARRRTSNDPINLEKDRGAGYPLYRNNGFSHSVTVFRRTVAAGLELRTVSQCGACSCDRTRRSLQAAANRRAKALYSHVRLRGTDEQSRAAMETSVARCECADP